MVTLLAVLLILALLFGGLGFAVHTLWWIALVVLVVWLISLAVHGTRRL